MKDERRPHSSRHADHPSSTVIHKYENEPILRGWVRRGVEKGSKFWIIVAAVCLGFVAILIIASNLLLSESPSKQAWMDLVLAKSSEQQAKVAETYPQSAAGRWALLESAGAMYNQAFELLTTKRDEASPLFKKAYELYSQAYKESEKADPDVARLAAFGMARTLEASLATAKSAQSLGASDDLKRTIAQYDLVASKWPDTEEGKRAAKLAKALRDRKNLEFYEWLATYTPPVMTLPPRGRGFLDDLPSPLGSSPFPSTGFGAGIGEKTPSGSELPENVFGTTPEASPLPDLAPPSSAQPPSADKPAESPPPATAPATKQGETPKP